MPKSIAATLERSALEFYRVAQQREYQAKKYAKQNFESYRPRLMEGLLVHQKAFCEDTKHRYLGISGGFGCGKTLSLSRKSILLSLENPGNTGLILAPNYPMLRDVIIPAIHSLLNDLSIGATFRVSPLPEYTLEWGSKILLRSFENWNRLRGVNAAWALVDEIDTVKEDIATKAWQLLDGRIRVGKVNQLCAVSTPEGFKFFYKFFVEKAADDRRLIKAKTTDNPYLPASYIEGLKANYPPNLIKAYLEGEFVNLANAGVYPDFDREKNASNETIKAGERLHIGIDFNLNINATAVHVLRDKELHCVDEIWGTRDTPALIEAIKARYQGHPITVYPDASGGNRSTANAAVTDLVLLRQAGFHVHVKSTNPSIKDRVTSVNRLICDSNGLRRYFVRTKECPHIVESLEKQAYDEKTQQPDKSNNLDHGADCVGYTIFGIFPIADNQIILRNTSWS